MKREKKIGKKAFLSMKKKEETKKDNELTLLIQIVVIITEIIKEEGFMYLDHRTVDGKNNIIIDCHIPQVIYMIAVRI